MGKIEVNPDYCKACELCVTVCPNQVLSLGDHPNTMGYFAVVADPAKKCVACKMCAVMCPEGAISVYKE